MDDNMNKPVYQAPQVTTYTDEQILEMLGPALTMYGPNQMSW